MVRSVALTSFASRPVKVRLQIPKVRSQVRALMSKLLVLQTTESAVTEIVLLGVKPKLVLPPKSRAIIRLSKARTNGDHRRSQVGRSGEYVVEIVAGGDRGAGHQQQDLLERIHNGLGLCRRRRSDHFLPCKSQSAHPRCPIPGDDRLRGCRYLSGVARGARPNRRNNCTALDFLITTSAKGLVSRVSPVHTALLNCTRAPRRPRS